MIQIRNDWKPLIKDQSIKGTLIKDYPNPQNRSRKTKIFLEFATKAFPEAEVKEIILPGIGNSDVGEIAIRLNKPNSRSIILKPSRSLMTDTNVNFLQVFLAGIQTAKKLLDNPPLKEQDFQGTILLNDKGVEIFLKAEKTDSVHL